jgi:hypothetical protein
MTINTKIRLTILASAFALAAAAPAAFADSGVWYRSMHTKPAATSAAPAAVHGEQLVNNKLASGEAEKSIQLTDGSTVHIFADGKMAMESQFGRATSMEAGHAMDTKDGKNLVMNGNEAARLDQLLNKDVSGG